MKVKSIHKHTKVELLFSLEDCVADKIDGSEYQTNLLLSKLIEKLNPSSEELTDWLADYDETLEIIP